MYGMARDTLRNEQGIIRDAAERTANSMAIGKAALDAASERVNAMRNLLRDLRPSITDEKLLAEIDRLSAVE
jgi:hypothetical protein